MTQDEFIAGIKPMKIRCATWCESAAVQRLLKDVAQAGWSMPNIPIPWQPKSKMLLALQFSDATKRWWLSWVAKQDFDTAPLPEVAAAKLLEDARSVGLVFTHRADTQG